jgi:hypothetical protein
MVAPSSTTAKAITVAVGSTFAEGCTSAFGEMPGTCCRGGKNACAMRANARCGLATRTQVWPLAGPASAPTSTAEARVALSAFLYLALP